MKWSDLIQPGLGAIIGFALAQGVNLIKLGWDQFNKPKFRIETDDNCAILSHSTSTQWEAFLGEKIYGFSVRNVGRRIATRVRFQILQIETRERSAPNFRPASNHTMDLTTYRNSENLGGDAEVTLLPGATALVSLAWWREDRDAVIPATSHVPDYYEEGCVNVVQYRFKVAAFDDGGASTTRTLSIRMQKRG